MNMGEEVGLTVDDAELGIRYVGFTYEGALA